ncbi:unnamed protein product, partial [Polarella glacialis]
VVSGGPKSGPAVGTVEILKELPATVEASRSPLVAVLETMTGWEDIPFGIAAVLLPSSQAVDTLSHAAIRARNQHVLLASCDDDSVLAELRKCAGQRLQLSVSAAGVTWSAAEKEVTAAAKASATAAPPTLNVVKPPVPPGWAIGVTSYEKNKKCLGGKSLHLAELWPKNGEYKVPQSVTVPFGIFEKSLLEAL